MGQLDRAIRVVTRSDNKKRKKMDANFADESCATRKFFFSVFSSTIFFFSRKIWLRENTEKGEDFFYKFFFFIRIFHKNGEWIEEEKGIGGIFWESNDYESCFVENYANALFCIVIRKKRERKKENFLLSWTRYIYYCSCLLEYIYTRKRLFPGYL